MHCSCEHKLVRIWEKTIILGNVPTAGKVSLEFHMYFFFPLKMIENGFQSINLQSEISEACSLISMETIMICFCSFCR